MFYLSRDLSFRFAQVRLKSKPLELLEVLANPLNDYVILANQIKQGSRVQLLVRTVLISKLLEMASLERLDKRKWQRLLERFPHRLPEFMGVVETGKPLERENYRSLPSIGLSLRKFVEHWFGVPTAVPVSAQRSVSNVTKAGLRVILSGESILGIFDPEAEKSSVSESAPSREYRELWHEQDQPRVAYLQRNVPSWVPPDAIEDSEPPPFVAHPRITPRGEAFHEQPFHFAVGFSNTPDAHAKAQKRIHIVGAFPGEAMKVFVSADGAEIEGESIVDLALDLKAERVFTLRPCAGIKELTLRANYLFRNKLVGSIVKTLTVRDPQSVPDPIPATPSVSPALSLRDPADVDPVDIVLWVQKEKTNHISWTVWAPVAGVRQALGPFSVLLEQPQAFGMQLASLQSLFGSPSGNGVHAELQGIGRRIFELIPRPIREEVLLPAFANGKSPSVLLMTDEPYVPWELAYFLPNDSDLKVSGFFGELAKMGRWWSGRSSRGPVSRVMIECVSALASDYQSNNAFSLLEHATKERDMLCREFNAQSIVARLPEVEAWLGSKPHKSGHLAHVALHGYSDTISQLHGLHLEDGQKITPHQFAGFPEEDVPRFSAVFLNACQVGTAGQQLGFLSGFPGAVVDAGTHAFIAPLWEVQDDVALTVADTFYRSVLGYGRTVGETFQGIRAMAREGGSITHLAYLFYGHPLLRMS